MMTQAELDIVRKQWEARVADFRASGLSGAQWCRDHGLPPRQLHYWLQKFRITDASASDATWLAVPVHPLPVVSEITIQVAGARIDVGPDFDPDLLRAVVRALV